MNSPHAHAGAIAGNLGFESTTRVAQSPSQIKNNNADLLRDYPILAVHWFGLKEEYEHEAA